MKTDSLYIDLAERRSFRAPRAARFRILDYDSDGRLVGIDNASNKVELKKLILSNLPGKVI